MQEVIMSNPNQPKAKIVRAAKQGDPGFDQSKDQVVIIENGVEKVVLRSDVD